MELIDCLMKAGFTKHESILYITLCREGELTGYEASKISGINRSNAYLALAGLVEKGGVYRIEGEAVKYQAILPQELSANLRRDYNLICDHIETNSPVRALPSNGYITISGRANIINKMKNIVLSAKKRIYVSMAEVEAALIFEELADAVERGLKVVVISGSNFSMKDALVYKSIKSPGQIRIIADSSHVLTGCMSGESTCLYSKNLNLVELIKDSLTNEIKLLEMGNTEKT